MNMTEFIFNAENRGKFRKLFRRYEDFFESDAKDLKDVAAEFVKIQSSTIWRLIIWSVWFICLRRSAVRWTLFEIGNTRHTNVENAIVLDTQKATVNVTRKKFAEEEEMTNKEKLTQQSSSSEQEKLHSRGVYIVIHITQHPRKFIPTTFHQWYYSQSTARHS